MDEQINQAITAGRQHEVQFKSEVSGIFLSERPVEDGQRIRLAG